MNKEESPEQRRERLRVAVQAICPVSGESLTSHANRQDELIQRQRKVLYVCCEDCLKSKPDAKHLDKIEQTLLKLKAIASL